jgi:hypothetical protein
MLIYCVYSESKKLVEKVREPEFIKKNRECLASFLKWGIDIGIYNRSTFPSDFRVKDFLCSYFIRGRKNELFGTNGRSPYTSDENLLYNAAIIVTEQYEGMIAVFQSDQYNDIHTTNISLAEQIAKLSIPQYNVIDDTFIEYARSFMSNLCDFLRRFKVWQKSDVNKTIRKYERSLYTVLIDIIDDDHGIDVSKHDIVRTLKTFDDTILSAEKMIGKDRATERLGSFIEDRDLTIKKSKKLSEMVTHITPTPHNQQTSIIHSLHGCGGYC